ncbi:heterokaryon incompatibility protein-domain-containing protein [Aspergillus avenaceus]|uniref:Heterokaryon incompatibility protein-domain-containing protein n=1 Tax=Aspergillus avenaceus TaxID=36643 RepID=A0A5N6U3E8_ASPAV|nr:heterokaryon incompatibility protein-domain-containing protein [Aspergillus avenaceus]
MGDIADSLESIQHRINKPIASILMDIAKNAGFKPRSKEWVRKLECLDLTRKRGRDDAKVLVRHCIDATACENYVAVSYVWDDPRDSSATGKYLIQPRDGGSPVKNNVRDTVLDRVTRYVESRRKVGDCIEGFWIDQQCIDQDDSEEKEVAMQSMEAVYSHSRFPIALLSVRIESLRDLETLEFILDRNQTFGSVGEERAREILALLNHITSDLWWERAWTFQEDYHASTSMRLLIRHEVHDSAILKLKRECSELGDIPGEISINSAHFRTKVTQFCKEYRGQDYYRDDCLIMMKKAVKYNKELLEPGDDGNLTIRRAMSPRIYSDVGHRQISREWDRLAIIANCCGYATRLDTTKLERAGSSLSMSMMYLFVLNGEILMNRQTRKSHLQDNIFGFLGNRSLRTFQTPGKGLQLTFIKHCRFLDVELTKDGIRTKGHLWRLGRAIDDATFPKPKRCGSSRSKAYRQKRLRRLANYLGTGDSGAAHEQLAQDLNNYVDHEPRDRRRADLPFSDRYKGWMATKVVNAMDTPGSLRLGCLSRSPYRGVFVDEEGWDQDQDTYVFTAMRPGKLSPDGVAKHVSLEVILSGHTSGGLPKLIVKRWINGLVFFDGYPMAKVVFPWPKSFIT